MKRLLSIILLTTLFELYYQYRIFFDDLQVEYIDKKYIDVQANFYNINKTTKALNSTLKLKTDIPDDTKVIFHTYRSINNMYNLAVFHLEKRLKDALEMESFDVQKLCLTYSRPPIVWPLKKNVVYRTTGWVPDASKYPINIPIGKWKIEQILKHPNKDTLAIANWFAEIES